MIRLLTVLALGVAICAYTSPSVAAEKEKDTPKEVKLDGTITCGKCDLKESTKCATTIVVEKDGKKVVYWLDEKASKANHGKVCQESKKGSVTGTVTKDGDKMIITATKVEFAK